MKVRCDYCGTMVDEKQSNCPNCGAVISGVQRYSHGQPQTMEELKYWYQEMKLPPEDVTRFYIGKDVHHAKAFGIYRDQNEDFVVYKNKADGTRAIRYQGSDEAYAVNELYQRLQEEIVNQKSRNAERRMTQAQQEETQNKRRSRLKRRLRPFIVMLAVFVILPVINVLFAIILSKAAPGFRGERTGQARRPAVGYYSYDGRDYYYQGQGDNWYYYDDEYDDWGHTVADQIPDVIVNDLDGVYHMDSHEGQAFEDTFWYHEPTTDSDGDSYDDYDRSYDSGWDDDDDWDSGWDDDDDWDYDYSDWDSDW